MDPVRRSDFMSGDKFTFQEAPVGPQGQGGESGEGGG